MGAEDSYGALAFAVIEKTVEDYRMALQAMKRHPEDRYIARTVADYEKWFMTEWFTELAQDAVDGLRIICTLRDEIGV